MEHNHEARINQIGNLLAFKASTKQAVYRNTLALFKRLKKVAASIVTEIDDKIEDKHVEVEYINVSEFEFQIKFSGDLLVFSMHSNVMTFPQGHILHKSPYIQEDSRRGFFGSIVVYNFLADSLKYKRLNDPGYLLARMFINIDNNFYIEGVRQLHFLHPDIAQNELKHDILCQFIESSMIVSMEIDSEMPNFEQERVISVHQKLSQNMLGNIQKVGFKMSAGWWYNNDSPYNESLYNSLLNLKQVIDV